MCGVCWIEPEVSVMQAFIRTTAIAAPIEGPNIDTDQILPGRFLKSDRAAGYGGFLFHDLRYDAAGGEKPEFILNRPPFNSAGILVADENFGCGSSREGAVYALYDFGIRVVIAPSFGDIFYSNSLKNALLPAIVPAQFAAALRRELCTSADPRLTVDLEAMTIHSTGGATSKFELDAFNRECLMKGVDEVGLAMQQAAAIEAFERGYYQQAPWMQYVRQSQEEIK